MALQISSPTFLGERPRGPTLGAREEVAPTSPPTALNFTVNTNKIHYQHYFIYTIQYKMTVHYTNSTIHFTRIFPHACACVCARVQTSTYEHHTPYLCQCSKYTHRAHASLRPHVVSYIWYFIHLHLFSLIILFSFYTQTILNALRVYLIDHLLTYTFHFSRSQHFAFINNIMPMISEAILMRHIVGIYSTSDVLRS